MSKEDQKSRSSLNHRFGEVTTPEAVAALAQIRKLREESGSGECKRIAAIGISEAVEQLFAAAHQVKKAPSSHCIRRLLGESCGYNRGRVCSCRPPGDDHGQLWLKDGKPHLWISQPYSIGGEMLKQAIQFAETNDLKIEVSAESSFHYPGRTFAIIYTPKDSL